MPSYVVSGRMAVLFDRVPLPLENAEDGTVTGFRCRWCGFTCVVDDPQLIPDHDCRGPSRDALLERKG